MARLIESLDYWGWHIVGATNPKLAKKLPKPKPVEHPDRKQQTPRKPVEPTDSNRLARFFGIGRRKGGEQS